MSKFGWWKIIVGLVLVLLPGSMLLLPFGLLVLRRLRAEQAPSVSVGEASADSGTAVTPATASALMSEVPAAHFANA